MRFTLRVILVISILILLPAPVFASQRTFSPTKQSAHVCSPSESEAEQAIYGSTDPEAGLDDEVRSEIGPFSKDVSSEFSDRLRALLKKALKDWNLLGLRECLHTMGIVLAAAMFCRLTSDLEGAGKFVSAAACMAVTAACVGDLRSMIGLGTQTVSQIHRYVRLLLPGMTALMVTSGSVSGAGTLYAGATVFFDVLIALMSGLLIPMIKLHAVLCAGEALLDQGNLEKLRGFLKWLITVCLRWIFFGFSAFLTLTGLFSEAVDAQKLKAARAAISGLVPVVGGLVSDASQSLLSAAGMMKTAVGVYGMLAVFAICLAPFFRLWLQYLCMKLTAALCGLFGSDRVGSLTEKLSESMGMVVGVTGACCLMTLLILALCVRTVRL